MKWFLLLCLSTSLFANQDNGYDYLPVVEQIQVDIKLDRLKNRAQLALNKLILVTAFRLRLYGQAKEAKLLKEQWQQQQRMFFSNNLSIYALGDYRPLSQWLADWYRKVSTRIPEKVLKALRISDLNVFNFAIPVVFDPTNSSWDKSEYKLHYVPFLGVIAYWSVNWSCAAAAGGTGIALLCGPSGNLAERVMVNRIAPRASDRTYDRANSENK